ncbi:MAG: C80 family cysteine peptidase [Coxiellaceae bacterium]|nr:C80 family cysteine peptidase [Coxiellaceae bacterium]
MRKQRVIVGIGGDDAVVDSVERIKAKWCSKPGRVSSDCTYIPLNTSDPLGLPGKYISMVSNECTEIVIVAHGSSLENKALYHSADDAINLQVIAAAIELLVDPETMAATGKPVLKINLVSCFGAYKDGSGADSPAETLHRLLYERGLHAEITARNSVVRIESSGRKSTFSLMDRDRVIREAESETKIDEEGLSWYEAPVYIAKDIVRYFRPASVVTEIHGPGSKVVFFSDPADAEYNVRQRNAVPRQSAVQQARSQHAAKVLRKHWATFTASSGRVPSMYKDGYDVIFNEVLHRRFNSYAEVVGHIDYHMKVYGLLSTGGVLRMFYDSHAGFKTFLLNAKQEISELLELSENPRHLISL